MVSDVINNLNEKRYRQGKDLKIGRDILTPCLKECKRYRRCTGTYGSSAFKNYLGALGDIVKEGTVIEILTSMNGIAKDSTLYSALKGTKDEKGRNEVLQKHCNDIGLIVAGCQTTADTSNRDYFQKLIAYLIANKQLIIKFALPLNDELISEDFWNEEDIKQRAMYHFKYGYFVFPDDSILAFDGSVNETDTALFRSGEMITLHKDWVDGQKEDAKQIKDFVDDDWGETNDNFRIFKISDKTLEIIKKYSSDKRPINPNPPPNPEPIPKPQPEIDKDEFRWRHKEEALNIFLEKKAGILAMATGTGKTKTALKIANKLFEDNLIDSCIITMVGNPLLSQWNEELLDDEQFKERIVFRHFENEKKMQGFLNKPNGSVLLITSNELGNLMKYISDDQAKKSLIIYDEVHDMGAPIRMSSTLGQHKKFTYRLGLSATPDRGEFDEDGTQFLFDEIGPIIYPFGIEKAIQRGILVEFDYVPLSFELTDEENQKIRSIIAGAHFPDKNGKKKSEKEIRMAISDVKKQSLNMITTFDHYLKKNGIECLRRTIIFVHSKKFGEEVTKVINENGMTSYNTFYDKDKDENLIKLAENKIDCLITCHKVSQGIDIKSLNNVIIFASSVINRETIQRLGRALRTEKNNPNKRALMVDFCVYDDEEGDLKSDTKRKLWLTELSKSKKME